MNIIYKNDTLYVDMIEGKDEGNLKDMKTKVFSILDGFDVSNVVINAGGMYKSNKESFSSLMKEYKENYSGNLKIK